MLLLDIQKAFNTVDHLILIVNLLADGLSKDSVRRFSSYLLDKKQLVDFCATISFTTNVTCGVSQGYILGRVLFLMHVYVNDKSAMIKILSVTLCC